MTHYATINSFLHFSLIHMIRATIAFKISIDFYLCMKTFYYFATIVFSGRKQIIIVTNIHAGFIQHITMHMIIMRI